jgi:hypothetical protein
MQRKWRAMVGINDVNGRGSLGRESNRNWSWGWPKSHDKKGKFPERARNLR